MSDNVNRPPHYIARNGMEAVDVIEAFDLGWHLGNAAKYILRSGRKKIAPAEEDLRKAIWFIERAIKVSRSR